MLIFAAYFVHHACWVVSERKPGFVAALLLAADFVLVFFTLSTTTYILFNDCIR